MKTLFITLLFTVVLSSCKYSKNERYKINTVASENKASHPGKKLMETYCYACHNHSTAQDSRIAPPMIAIKKHYINDDTTKDEFIKLMQDWIKNPTEEKAKMYGAVRRFGVMPKTPYPDESIKQIADYIFDFEIDKPEWFEEHFNEERGKGMMNDNNGDISKGNN